MDGSQLPTEWTHLNSNLVTGVSDSKKRDVPAKHFGSASEKGPISEKIDGSKSSDMPKMPKNSKKPTMAETSESGTIG